MTRGRPAGLAGAVAFRSVDRYLLPSRTPELVPYFLDRLFVSHGLLERLGHWTLARIPAPGARRSLFRSGEWMLSRAGQGLQLTEAPPGSRKGATWSKVLPLLDELLEQSDLLEAAGLDGGALHRSILLHDYDEAARGRVLVFPIPEGRTRPEAVIKLRDPAGNGRPLRAEWQALQWVRSRLGDPALKATVPEARAFRETAFAEILVLAHLDGRSAYWYQQNCLLPGGRARSHMEAAADWLARFHQALATDPAAGCGPSHGDFWARNLLLGKGGQTGGPASAVVDWELFDPEGPSHQDLFHFPLTYAQNHPDWRFRRASLPSAFRRAFVQRTPLSGAIRAYFARYCARTGIAPPILEPLLKDYLRARARQAERNGGQEWLECLDLLEHSGWVFSS